MSYQRDLLSYLATIIVFKDATLKELLLADSTINSDGTREISYDEAKSNSVSWTVIDSAINASTDIVSFNELKYFNVGTIPDEFLGGCTNLEEVEFPPTLTTWALSNGNLVFNNTKIKKLDLSHLTSIYANFSNYVFGTLNSLEEVDISNVTYLSGRVFNASKQPNISKVKIGSIDQFFDIEIINDIYFGAPWCSKKASLYIGDTLVQNITVPNSVTAIPAYTFYYIQNLRTIVIPSTCTQCGKYSFAGLDENVSIQGLDYITTINDYSFKDCQAQGITNVPNNVTDIGREAYINSAIAHVDSNTLQTIDYNAFEGSGITYIKANSCILLKSPNYTESLYAIFRNCTELLSVEMNSLTIIPPATFTGCTALTTVKMQAVTTMYGGFYGCTSLTSVDMPNVVYMARGIFRNCSKIDNTIANTFTIDWDVVEHIGIECFRGCVKLVCPSDFPDNLIYIGDSAFRECILPSTQTYVIMRTNNNGAGVTYETYNNGSTPVYNPPFPCTQHPTTGAITAGVSKIYVPSATLSWYTSDTEWAALCTRTGLQFDDIANIPV